jgi:hypothetical protein
MAPTLSHCIHLDLGMVVTSWKGFASNGEMHTSHRNLYAHPSWRPGMDELVDLREADLSGITREGMQGLAEIVARAVGGNGNGIRTAILAESDLVFGMARLYGGHQSEDVGDVQVFRSAQDALAWLGLEAWPTDPDVVIRSNGGGGDGGAAPTPPPG